MTVSPAASTPRIGDDLDAALRSPAMVTDPYPVYDRLRREDPVHWSPATGAWILGRYADVARVLREDGRSFGTGGRTAKSLATLPADAQNRMGLVRRHFSVGLMHTDPPDHVRLRAQINRAFTPATVAAAAPRIEALANAYLDRLTPAGGFDVLADYAYPLPAQVVAEVLGIPYDLDRMKVWIAASQAFGTAPLTVDAADGMVATLTEARAMLADTAERRRHDPRDDIISRLVAAEAGDAMTMDELLSTAMTLIMGAYHTTAALIGNAVEALFAFPAQRERLLADPGLLPAAVEEFLRYETPAPRVTRIARTDVTIGGRTIRRGDLVVACLASADRDPAAFASPDVLDVGRSPNRHLAFAMGEHHCLGAPLARLEARIAIGTLLARVPALALADEPLEWEPNPAMRIRRRLPVEIH